MSRITQTLFLLFVTAPLALAQPTAFVGDWSGMLDLSQVGGEELELILHISEGADGLAATMDSPQQGAMGVEASEVSVAGDTLHLTFSDIQGELTATPGEGESLDATWAQMGMEFPAFALTPWEAPPEEPTVEPSSALSSFVGKWKAEAEGEAQFPPMRFTLAPSPSVDSLASSFLVVESGMTGEAPLPNAYLEGDSLVIPFPPANGDGVFRGAVAESGDGLAMTLHVSGQSVDVRFTKDYPVSEVLEPYVGTWNGWVTTGDAGEGQMLSLDLSSTPDVNVLAAAVEGTSGEQAGTALIEDDQLVVVREDEAYEIHVALVAGEEEDDDSPRLEGQAEMADGTVYPVSFQKGRGRPQTPRPPFSYESEEVTVESAPGVTLAGTLTIPEGEGPFPAVVLLSGSGPQDRNETLAGHQPFLVLSDWLTKAGIAVLRYDDRGTAASTGDFGLATLEDFAADATAAVEWLDARPETADVGIIGHSEGGYLAPWVANEVDAVDFVVMLAGPAVSGAEVYAEQHARTMEAGGADRKTANVYGEAVAALIAPFVEQPDVPAGDLSEEAAAGFSEALSGLSDEELQALGATGGNAVDQWAQMLIGFVSTPGTRSFLSYDPRPALEALDVPTLAFFGEKDVQVPADQNAEPMRSLLSTNEASEVRVEEGLNHLFQTAETGSPDEYEMIDETIAPRVMSKIELWILRDAVSNDS